MGRGKKHSMKNEQHKKKPTDKYGNNKRKPKHCTRCRLHGENNALSKEHLKMCPFKHCENFLCRNVAIYHQTMKVQLGTWRKNSRIIPSEKEKNTCLCDKCRNHLIRTNKVNHEKDCPFKSCIGIMCRFADARRQIVAFFLKIKRSNVLCNQFEHYYIKNVADRETNTSSTSYRISKEISRVEQPCIEGNTYRKKYQSQIYPERLSCQHKYTSSSYISPASHYKLSTPNNYQRIIFHPQCVWSHSKPYMEGIYVPSSKVNIGSYISPPALIEYGNYSKYGVYHPKFTDYTSLKYTSFGVHNIFTPQGDTKPLYRPWL